MNVPREILPDGTSVNSDFREHPHYAKLGEIGKKAMTAILTDPDVRCDAPDLPAWVNGVSNYRKFWSQSYPNLCVEDRDWLILHVFEGGRTVEICDLSNSELSGLVSKVLRAEDARKEARVWSHLAPFIP